MSSAGESTIIVFVVELREDSTMTLSWLVREYGEVASTQEVAKKLALEGAREGTVVLAKRQNSGRGRMGRHWLSPEGGLYLSIILRPGRVEGVQLLTLVGTLAAAEGTRMMIVPMVTARTFFRKVRRSSEGEGMLPISVMGRGFYGGLRVRYKWGVVTLDAMLPIKVSSSAIINRE